MSFVHSIQSCIQHAFDGPRVSRSVLATERSAVGRSLHSRHSKVRSETTNKQKNEKVPCDGDKCTEEATRRLGAGVLLCLGSGKAF